MDEPVSQICGVAVYGERRHGSCHGHKSGLMVTKVGMTECGTTLDPEQGDVLSQHLENRLARQFGVQHVTVHTDRFFTLTNDSVDNKTACGEHGLWVLHRWTGTTPFPVVKVKPSMI